MKLYTGKSNLESGVLYFKFNNIVYWPSYDKDNDIFIVRKEQVDVELVSRKFILNSTSWSNEFLNIYIEKFKKHIKKIEFDKELKEIVK